MDNETNMDDYSPTAASYASDVDFSDSAYDDLIKDAERDDRVGDHDWMVTKVNHDFWPSGDPRIKIVGVLLTASGKEKPKADLTISPPPSADTVRAEGKEWDQGKKRAIATTVTMYRQLAQQYGTSPDKITEGDVFRVKTAKTKVDQDGRGGFVRVVAFKPKAEIGTQGQQASSVPF